MNTQDLLNIVTPSKAFAGHRFLATSEVVAEWHRRFGEDCIFPMSYWRDNGNMYTDQSVSDIVTELDERMRGLAQ